VNGVNRRGFVRASAAAAAATLARPALAAPAQDAADSVRVRRFKPLGKTGWKIGDVSAGSGQRDPAVLNYIFETGINLIDKPDQALDPKIAAIIIFEGMRLGTFTGKKLSDYFNGATEKWVEARRIVNGTDKNKPIAFYGRTFYAGISYTTGT